MLELLSKFICLFMLSIFGYFFIKEITTIETKIHKKKNILLIVLLSLIQLFLYKIQYTSSYTIIVFYLNILIYKIIFNISTEDSILLNGMLIIVLFICDILVSLLFMNFYNRNYKK